MSITLSVSACLFLLLSGCSSPKPRFVIVLLDETESFALYTQKGRTPIKVFSINNNAQQFEKELNEGKISEELKKFFIRRASSKEVVYLKDEVYFLPEQPTVEKINDNVWRIEDYLIKRENNRLDVYITTFWPEVLYWTTKIVNSLKAGDMFCVIGIDEYGFDGDDVRMIKTLDKNLLRAMRQKRKIVERVKRLTRRKKYHRKTDILEALEHAAFILYAVNYFSNKHQSTHGVIAVFSDMFHEPKPNRPRPPSLKEASNLSFPKDTEIHCFYCGASGRAQWQTFKQEWTKVFKQAGLEDKNFDFSQPTGTKPAFDKLFSN